MKCIYCKQEIQDGKTITPVDGGFVCGLICKSMWDRANESFDKVNDDGQLSDNETTKP